MATTDVDWQSTKKTVLERSRHMFNNPFSDVVFTCEGSGMKFFAHKYVLATSSAVFYANFYGELAVKHLVFPLSDTNDESLQEFLRFLYADECFLTTDNALSVLYLAKKYIVPSLAEKCVEFLEANIGVENALTVLQQAIHFDETNLEDKCWDLIDLQTSEAIASDAFAADINQATLAWLLKRESLNVKEVDLFKAVLKWSEAECSRKGIEPNAKNKRAAIGKEINQIRFASMTAQQFADNVSQSGILTREEIILMYEIISGVEKPSGLWNLSERRAKEESLLRCRRFDSYLESTMPGSFLSSLKWSGTWKDALSISFDRPVKIHGVCMLGYEGKEYNVKLEVFSQQLIENKFRPQRHSSSDISGFDVMLPVPIKVQANVIVHMKSTTTGYRTFRIGSEGQKTVETKGIIVNFSDTPGVCDSQTSVEKGQFDEIIFSEI